jgi:hypothetical protein
VIDECLLEGPEVRGLSETLDCHYGATVSLTGKIATGANRCAVYKDGARAADLHIAGELCSRKPELIPQEIEEKIVRLHFGAYGSAIDG